MKVRLKTPDSKIQIFFSKVLILLAGLVLMTEAGRVPRTEEVEVEPEVEEPKPEGKAKQVPIYMPAMPMLYRQSDQAPVFQYVPVPDPRFISLGGGGYANLGLISAGGNFGVDGNQGTFHAGAGAGLGQNFATYGQQGVTTLPKIASRTVQPAIQYAPYVPPTPKMVVYF